MAAKGPIQLTVVLVMMIWLPAVATASQAVRVTMNSPSTAAYQTRVTSPSWAVKPTKKTRQIRPTTQAVRLAIFWI